MAKYTVTRACGHTETVALFGKGKDREWRLENVEPQKLCSECWQAKIAEEREKENREAAEAAKEMNLPTLTGTEKQVAWAETIRQQMLADIDKFVFQYVKPECRNDIRIQEPIHSIHAKTSASWWIDHRGETGCSSYTKRLLEAEHEALKKEGMQTPKGVVSEVKIEATVRPENPKTETVAEIRALEKSVEIAFPERRDDFREVVKGMGFSWQQADKCWWRAIKDRNGTPADRAAEAGHRLLASGFVIRVYDKNVRAKAIAGDYEPECTRWVLLRTGERYTGWLAISWGRGEDFYKAAKRIKGARYSKPSVVVPSENYEEVLDFAKMYGFRVSQAAQEAIDAARVARDNALTVSISQPDAQSGVMADRLPPVLDVPQEVEIDEDLRDNN